MSRIDPASLMEWQSAIGRSERRVELVEQESLRRYALAVGADPGIERRLPPLAQWALFLPQPGDEVLDSDGHPRRGGFIPAVTLPRRMFAAADIVFEAPLLPGEPAEMVAKLVGVTHKVGRSGDLVFVDVDRVITQRQQVRIREWQRYVYRDAGAPTSLPVPSEAAHDGEEWQPGVVNLFRFSAATFNSHRIHYDLPYAQEQEGYPALVIQGPYTAAKLAALAERRGPLKRFSFHAAAPLFVGQPIALQAAGAELRAVRCDGVTAMSAEVHYQ